MRPNFDRNVAPRAQDHRPPPGGERKPPPRYVPGDTVISAAEIAEFGLEEVSEDMGPSWLEIAVAKARRADNV